MKNVVMFLTLALANGFQMSVAMEPLIVLQKQGESLVYRMGNDGGEMIERYGPGERRANRKTLIDTQLGDPLQESPELARLRVAYTANYLDCGPYVDPDALKKDTRERIEWAETNQGWLRTMRTYPIDDRHVMVSESGGATGIVLNRETGQRLPGSPCGAEVQLARVSPDESRVAIVFEEFKAITFYGRLGWGSQRTSRRFVQIHQLDAPGIHITTPKIEEEDPFDVMLTDQGTLWLLVAEHSMEWWKPQNWIFALAGHASRYSEVFLYTFDSTGRLVSRRKVASASDGGFERGRILSPLD